MGYLPDSGGYYMLWFRTADNRFVRDWCHRDRLLDKAVEEFATTSGRPPVEPECEFVQVIVEMFATHRSLVSAEEPAFQQRRHTMNSWHQLRGRFLLASEKGHSVSISPGFHWIVSKPAIRVNGTTRLDSLLHKGEQTLCRRVGYLAEGLKRWQLECASSQSKTHQEQCILKSSLISGSNFSVALNGQTRGTPS